jgi:hypothetical protein
MTIRLQSLAARVFATAFLLVSCVVIKHAENSNTKEADMNKKANSSRMNRNINAWIDIDAPPKEVWNVLVDFKSWESWNCFIPIVEGNLKVGERMRIRVVPPGLKAMIFKPEVYAVIPYEKIIWGGSFLKFLYRGDHSFLLEPAPDGKTRFRQIERFKGPMVLFMAQMIEKTEIGYHQMNQALKEQVEKKRFENQKGTYAASE